MYAAELSQGQNPKLEHKTCTMLPSLPHGACTSYSPYASYASIDHVTLLPYAFIH